MCAAVAKTPDMVGWKSSAETGPPVKEMVVVLTTCVWKSASGASRVGGCGGLASRKRMGGEREWSSLHAGGMGTATCSI